MNAPLPPPASLAVQACGADCVAAITPAEMLRLADDYCAQGRAVAADALLRALFDNPVVDVRPKDGSSAASAATIVLNWARVCRFAAFGS